jgi:hypothetical protein
VRKGAFQVWVGVLLLAGGISYPIAYAAQRFLGVSFAIAFAATASIVLLCVAAAFAYFRRKDVQSSQVMSWIETLSAAEAEKRARALLADGGKFEVVRRPADRFPLAEELAGRVRDFFREIESLKAVHGDAELIRADIGRSTLNPSYIRIGRDIESVEINVRPGEETIYEIDAFDTRKPFAQHASIDHWLLALDEILYH